MAAKKKAQAQQPANPGWASVNPKGIGNEDAGFASDERKVAGQQPMFKDIETLRFCIEHQSAVGAAIAAFALTVLVPDFRTKVGRPIYRSKGNNYLNIEVTLTLYHEYNDLEEDDPRALSVPLAIPQDWTIDIDLWGAVRGYREFYPDWEHLDNEEEFFDNKPDDPDSQSVQIEEGPNTQFTQEQLREAIEAYVYGWAAAASREASIIYAQYRRVHPIREWAGKKRQTTVVTG